MPVYILGEDPVFPPPKRAGADGLLAIGGDLSSRRLLAAYRQGVFPWYGEGDPVMWFSPDPREVIVPSQLRLGRGMRRSLRQAAGLRLQMDSAFDEVISACATVRRRSGGGTWLTAEMIQAYRQLHRLGYVHSAEVWNGDRLVGGVYGVAVGSCFSGESMFHRQTGASLLALVALIRQLERWGFALFDCQTASEHVRRLGGQPWPREDFLCRWSRLATTAGRRGSWALHAGLAVAGAGGVGR